MSLNPYRNDIDSLEYLAETSASLLATVRHLMTGKEIRHCETYSDEAWAENASEDDFDSLDPSVVTRLANQFAAEIAAQQLAETIAYSRKVTATHTRLNPAA